MIKMEMNLIWPGCAQETYTLKAKGCILAVLRWGDIDGPSQEWSPFAYAPIDPAGNGSFYFSGRRGIPPHISHVWACCHTADFASCETASAAIPQKYQLPELAGTDELRFSVLTDLHLVTKPWKARQALRAAESPILFLLGDATNDGLKEQFDRFLACA